MSDGLKHFASGLWSCCSEPHGIISFHTVICVPTFLYNDFFSLSINPNHSKSQQKKDSEHHSAIHSLFSTGLLEQELLSAHLSMLSHPCQLLTDGDQPVSRCLSWQPHQLRCSKYLQQQQALSTMVFWGTSSVDWSTREDYRQTANLKPKSIHVRIKKNYCLICCVFTHSLMGVKVDLMVVLQLEQSIFQDSA